MSQKNASHPGDGDDVHQVASVCPLSSPTVCRPSGPCVILAILAAALLVQAAAITYLHWGVTRAMNEALAPRSPASVKAPFVQAQSGTIETSGGAVTVLRAETPVPDPTGPHTVTQRAPLAPFIPPRLGEGEASGAPQSAVPAPARLSAPRPVDNAAQQGEAVLVAIPRR